MAENGASPTSARRNASICRGRAPRHTATWHLDCPIHRISSKRNKTHYDMHSRDRRQSELGMVRTAASRRLVWRSRVELRPTKIKPLAFRSLGRRPACPSALLRRYRHRKARLPVRGGVANPRNGTGYCCGLLLATNRNPSLYQVPQSTKQNTSRLSASGTPPCPAG